MEAWTPEATLVFVKGLIAVSWLRLAFVCSVGIAGWWIYCRYRYGRKNSS